METTETSLVILNVGVRFGAVTELAGAEFSRAAGLLRAPVHRNRATAVRVSVLVADKPGSWEVVFKTERQNATS